jgi:hypothetical protein
MLENPPPVVKLLPRSLWQATSSRPHSGPEIRIKKYSIRLVSYVDFSFWECIKQECGLSYFKSLVVFIKEIAFVFDRLRVTTKKA